MPTPDIIAFSKLKGPFRLLPNFAPTPVTIDEVVWPSSEHYYQAQKFLLLYLQKTILAAPTPRDAADIGRRNADLYRPDWAEIKVTVMHTALRAKARQHPAVATVLLGTGEATLVERSAHDTFWGSGPDGSGQNHLGKLWMVVRDELRGVRPEIELSWPDKVLLPTGKISPDNFRLTAIMSKNLASGRILPEAPMLFGKFHRQLTRNGFMRIPRPWLPRWDPRVTDIFRRLQLTLPKINPLSEWRISVLVGERETIVLLEPADLADRGDRARGYGEWLPKCYRTHLLARNGLIQLPARVMAALGESTSEVVLNGGLTTIRLFTPKAFAAC